MPGTAAGSNDANNSRGFANFGNRIEIDLIYDKVLVTIPKEVEPEARDEATR